MLDIEGEKTMRKVVLALLALFVSLNVSAATNDLSSEISKTLEKQNSSSGQSTIVYGGKDISRSIVASASESSWTKPSSSLIG